MECVERNLNIKKNSISFYMNVYNREVFCMYLNFQAKVTDYTMRINIVGV